MGVKFNLKEIAEGFREGLEAHRFAYEFLVDLQGRDERCELDVHPEKTLLEVSRFEEGLRVRRIRVQTGARVLLGIMEFKVTDAIALDALNRFKEDLIEQGKGETYTRSFKLGDSPETEDPVWGFIGAFTNPLNDM